MLQSSQMEVTLFFVVSISLFDELREGLKIETTLFFFHLYWILLFRLQKQTEAGLLLSMNEELLAVNL